MTRKILGMLHIGILYAALFSANQRQADASTIGIGTDRLKLQKAHEYANRNGADDTSSQNIRKHSAFRKLQSTTVECGAVIGTLSTAEIKSKLLSSSLVPTSAAGFAMFLVKYDVQARKICASCRDASMNPVARSSWNTTTLQEYCGSSAYGSDATVSGLMLVPVDGNGKIVEGPMAGHINGHQALTETYSQIPSETFDNFEKNWLSIVAASSGRIAIEPDYLGYGESSDYFKSFLIRPAYPTATLPLWQYAVETIAAESDCRSYLKPVAFVTGYGEGAYAALSIAEALQTTLNVKIVKASLGGGPYRMASLMVPRFVDNINERQMTSDHYYLLALLGSSYSSTNPWAANYGKGQDLLDPQYRDKIVRLVQEGGSVESFLESMPAKVTDIINPEFFLWMKKMAVQGEYMGCLADGAPMDEDFNGHFCSALLENDLTHLLQNAAYDIDLCHSADDEVFHVDNLPPELDRNSELDPNSYTAFMMNARLTRQLASGSHESAYRLCSQLAITEGLFTNPRLSPITECSPRQTRRPTMAPTTAAIPTVNTPTPAPIEATLATFSPTPKPTSSFAGVTGQESSASSIGGSFLLVLLGISTMVWFGQ